MTIREARSMSVNSALLPEQVSCGGDFFASQLALDATNFLLKDAMSGADHNRVFSGINELLRVSREITPFDVVKRLPVFFDQAIKDFTATRGELPSNSPEDHSALCDHLLVRIKEWIQAMDEDAEAETISFP